MDTMRRSRSRIVVERLKEPPPSVLIDASILYVPIRGRSKVALHPLTGLSRRTKLNPTPSTVHVVLVILLPRLIEEQVSKSVGIERRLR